ncbi:TetR/AcrR family transcriptional regulator [Clostridium estertheticum]|uniref:TetR/AcrR family transcriptional regulator n=1 Tax=Clostridium estertheticum TaxID=238834 RepID=UPI001C7D3C83|nr:TetR/AcrR family transcriptional regulator [Clostridium estertheticum]MBX4265704.1 TetR/AcrR family transcriptional regulator [Clostridium estertheticum]WLC90959.1 TetR/AcrR family transcriptional regulator [Clostridium estertheticum]
MSVKNKGNSVSNQSKLWMEDALLKLMQAKNYHEITIQEITDNAGLSRRTFYRNYFSKDEILEGCFYKIWLEYESIIRKQIDLTLPNIARIFFSVMKKHFDFLSLINRHHLLSLFLSKVDELLPPAFDEVKGEKMPFPKENIQYALTFSTGGFMRILIRWLNDSTQKSPEEMATIVKDFVSICNYSNPVKKQITHETRFNEE